MSPGAGDGGGGGSGAAGWHGKGSSHRGDAADGCATRHMVRSGTKRRTRG